jgi:hypothetical protein
MNHRRTTRIAPVLTTAVTAGVAIATGAHAAGPDRIFSQSGAVGGAPEEQNRLGSSLAIGDFDGDGFDDAAIGAPGEAIGDLAGAGAVNILYGSSDGLSTAGNQLFSQNSSGVNGVSETGDLFGSSLVAGDFDGDGNDDLAIGVPGEDIGSTQSAGMVNVLYGSASGLSSVSDQSFHQATAGISGSVEPYDRVG